MIFVLKQNDKYIRDLLNSKGEIVFQEEITEDQFNKYLK